MKFLYRLIRYFFVLIIRIFYSIKTIFVSIFTKKKIFILNTPIHGNLGDQAILLAEEHIINDTVKGYKTIKIANKFCKCFPWLVKMLTKNSPVCIHGGGYLGDLWPGEDKTIRKLISELDDRKILFFPQTLCSENLDKYFNEVRPLFEGNKELVFFGRDQYSYDNLSKSLKNKVFYSPDIVLYEKFRHYKKEDKITLCLRHDHEKTMTNNVEKELIDAAKQYNYELTDTVIDKTIFTHNREKENNKILEKIGTSKFLITDRLHGMIFAYLTKTPCLVFNSKSPKVLGVYKWLEKSDYIVLHDAKKNISEEIEELYGRKFKFNESVTREDFNEIKKVILEIVK